MVELKQKKRENKMVELKEKKSDDVLVTMNFFLLSIVVGRCVCVT
jgi:hypothetical protein